jgi:hypothetical protein
MLKIASLLTLTVVVLVVALHASPARAQRVFVAATGSDGNPCTFATPCRSFQHAHDVAPANAEIDVLDPGGYGALTITKAISIQGHGYSGVSVASGATGITINAPLTAAINLNGLLLDGAGVGQIGVQFNSGASLVIQNSVFRNLAGVGINYTPSSGTSKLTISNTLVSDNGDRGIHVAPSGSAGAIKAAFNRVEVNNNGSDGIFVDASNAPSGIIDATASESTAANNGGVGFRSAGPGAGPAVAAVLNVFHSTASDNSTGVQVDAFGKIDLAFSMLNGNTTASYVVSANGVIESWGDNYVNDTNGPNSGSFSYDVGLQ